MLQSLYRGLTHLAGPAVYLWILKRCWKGKEDRVRLGERFGQTPTPRPEGPLAWVHAASVGEANSMLVMISRLLAANPALNVLMTTGTVNSARLMAKRLPERAIHQYVPVDLPGTVNRFLDHWQPDIALWTESEIWPNTLAAIRSRGIPAAVVNARMSERSYRRWKWLPGSIGPLLRTFALALAQTEADAERLRKLGAAETAVVGNLKYSAEPPPASDEPLEELRRAIAARPAWLFASSHPGESEIALRVHETLASRIPGLLTVIVPRHAERGQEILDLVRSRGLGGARRSEGALPRPEHAVYIGDTMGELGVFYRLLRIVCMGGSFVRHGGQNPVEPALFGCSILYGPHMWNFAEITMQLEEAGGALRIDDAAALSKAVGLLLTESEERDRLGKAALDVTERNRLAVDRALAALGPLLRSAGVLPADETAV